MLNYTVTKHSNYVTPFYPTRSAKTTLKQLSKLKILYKHLCINSVFLKRHDLPKYKLYKTKQRQIFFFNHNTLVVKYKEDATKTKKMFFWSSTTPHFKNKISRQQYFEFQNLYFSLQMRLNRGHFKYYWLSVFLTPSIQTKFYYFTNKIKYFSNQRLIKQPVLLMYNTISKNNYYSPYLNIFKGLLLRKNLNTLFFFKNVLLQIQPKYNSKSYFFRHINFLKKFTTQSYLKLMLT